MPPSDAAEGRIKLDVVVTIKVDSPWEYRKPVPGLQSKDFTLLDNNQPAKILSFSAFDPTAAKPDPPVEVILVIDTVSRKSKDVLDDVQHGVEKFLRQNGGHLAQPVSIYRVSNAGLSVTPQPSTDGNALATEISQKGGLRKITLDQGDLSLQNSSFQNQLIHPQTALSALGSIVLIERRKPGRKLLVWVGYGGPGEEDYDRGLALGSRQSARFDWITEFSTRIREARIALFGVTFWQSPDRRFPYESFLVGVKSATQANPGNLAFEVLATQSGGLVLEKPDNDLTRLIDTCVQDAGAFYTISFDPPRTNAVDEYHDLKVEVSKPGLVARASTGYYDQPVYYDQPYVAAERVTVAQLEQALSNAHGRSDAETARQLSTMELTERMSSTRLSSWKARMPGTKSWSALAAVADASVFLGLPPAEIPTSAAPDLNAQRLMQSRTIDYLLKTIPKLPDFFATRTTAHYREPPVREGQTWKRRLAIGRCI
ncbi:MAG TPA: VWA domain-containing protein [Terracidiphilus sp.]